MLGQFHCREMQNPVLKVDDVLVGIEVGILDIVQIRCEDAKRLIHLSHLNHLRIVGCNAVLDETFQHIVRIETVHTALVDITQHAMPCTVPNEDVVQVLPNVICKCRTADDGISLCVEVNEVRMFHRCCMEHAMTRFHARTDGRCLVIRTLPFLAVKGRHTKDRINHLRIVSRPKSDEGAESGIRFRCTAVLRNVAAIKETLKLPSVLCLPQGTYNVEHSAVAILLRTVVHGLLSQHIFPQCGQHGFRPVGKRYVVQHISREDGKSIGQSADVKLHSIVRILDVEFRVELLLAVCVLLFRNTIIVAAAVKMNAIAADRFLGISVMSADLQLRQCIGFVSVVDVQEIHSLRNDEADTA